MKHFARFARMTFFVAAGAALLVGPALGSIMTRPRGCFTATRCPCFRRGFRQNGSDVALGSVPSAATFPQYDCALEDET